MDSKPTPTDYPDAGSYPVEGKVNATEQESGTTFQFTQKLVVEEPNLLTAEHVYTLTCK
jgi:hypothetical protein